VNRDSWKIVHDELAACCAALFEGCGVPTRCEGPLAADAPPAAGIVAFIGFSGAKLTGSLALVLPEALVEETHPMRGRIAGDPRAALHDWAGEISNQVLGRLKNRLLGGGIVLQLSTPIPLQGTELRGRAGAHDGVARFLFLAGSKPFELHFDANAETEVELSPLPPEDGGDEVTQGDCLLF
jgi:hypothetical protein